MPYQVLSGESTLAWYYEYGHVPVGDSPNTWEDLRWQGWRWPLDLIVEEAHISARIGFGSRQRYAASLKL